MAEVAQSTRQRQQSIHVAQTIAQFPGEQHSSHRTSYSPLVTSIS
jgi:hypothetical protein